MVRLVFCRYTQIRRSICTSESLRASTSVSGGFTLLRHSSPSFGSQQVCSYSNLSKSRIGRSMMWPLQEGRASQLSSQSCLYFHCAHRFRSPRDSPACWTSWSVFQDGSDRAVQMPTSSARSVWSQPCWPAAVPARRCAVRHSRQLDQQNRTPAHPKRHMLRLA